jgi:DNA polymerase elongation subunit (family B)
MLINHNIMKNFEFRLLDFIVKDGRRDVEQSSDSEASDSGNEYRAKQTLFSIQVFGLDEGGNTYCAHIENFKPFFFVKVPDKWKNREIQRFKIWLENKMPEYMRDSIVDAQWVQRKTLYGFDAGKEYNFACISFHSKSGMNKAKSVWMETIGTQRQLIPGGISACGANNLEIYESNILPLLRFFHIQNLSPSGWVNVDKHSCMNTRGNHELIKTTTCDYEFTVDYQYVHAIPDKETNVPYNICSYDIEASSSHGDFPLPVKNYKKLATDILNFWDQVDGEQREWIDMMEEDNHRELLKIIILTAFRKYLDIQPELYENILEDDDYQIVERNINEVYVKSHVIIQQSDLEHRIELLLSKPLNEHRLNAKHIYSTMNLSDVDKYVKAKLFNTHNSVLDIIECSAKVDREERLNTLTCTLDACFPPLEGDTLTYIGSTFWRYGEDKPYLNNCIALGECGKVPDTEIECWDTEREVLLNWSRLIKRQDPDIIIGYNIFGFDYTYMFQRAKENKCETDFLRLSRNKYEICGNCNKNKEWHLEEKELMIASGTHQLKFPKMPGRIQIDLYNYFRREYNLESYKLDFVSGYFIGDKVSAIKPLSNNQTKIKTRNLTGLTVENFVQFEEISHSSEQYQGGKKYKVKTIEHDGFTVEGDAQPDIDRCVVKWGLAKDDISPQDIFRMGNGTLEERALIAKYCIQDCNLVHYLLQKVDIVTSIVEMANICSVPLDFIVMRGQGIKLFSFVAKQCRRRNTLIPTIEKKEDGSYEGAIVLPPKTGLYLDEPVACVDYSSLYPSSMISENISHDSKVWTKEYDLDGNLICEDGNSEYDNLPKYQYVDIEYDTYDYIPNHRGKPEKTLTGKKICRFAQFPDDAKAIMPEILSDLLKARKSTRSSAKWKTVHLCDGRSYSGMLSRDNEYIYIKDRKETYTFSIGEVDRIEDTYNEFMKNVLDKRQLAIKVTANSLYGQCGARTSSFYEKDIAASTTATGRKLLTYGQRIIEDVYGDRICETSYGLVHSHAEYIYGDTDSVFMSFKLTDPKTNEKIRGKEALKITIELAKEAGELATKFLKAPHDLEYEKTFMPFCLLSKKRYVGMLYEEDPDKCYRKSMGIVLKRRDNAPIVKDVYGGIIDILMKKQNIQEAVQFTKQCLRDMVQEKYPLEKLVITKSLRGFYKVPKQIAHKVLADRIAKRDPGNKPAPGDRIPFVYIEKKKWKLQGDKVEHPEYIRNHRLKPDYSHYITNQIMKPVLQLFALVMEEIPGYEKQKQEYNKKVHQLEKTLPEDKYIDKRQKLREAMVKKLVFDDALRISDNSKKGNRPITSFFQPRSRAL